MYLWEVREKKIMTRNKSQTHRNGKYKIRHINTKTMVYTHKYNQNIPKKRKYKRLTW